MKLPFPGEIWVLTFSQAIPETKPLEIRITDVDSSLVWFTYTDWCQKEQIIATPISVFPTLYTYVRGSQSCKTPRKKSFSFKTVLQWLRSFFINAANSSGNIL